MVNNKPTKAEIKKNNDFTAVLLIWKNDVATHLSQVGVATMLSYYCRENLNGGIIEDARTTLNNEILRGIMGLGKDGAEMVLNEESPFWEWVNDDLHVNFYSLSHENEIIRKREGGRKGGLANGANRKKEKQDLSRAKSNARTINKERNNIYNTMSKEEGCTPPSMTKYDLLGKQAQKVKVTRKQSEFMESLNKKFEDNSNTQQNVNT